MRSVYLDNYRGFTSEVIALEDVNFCVGENSTGKTSFLSAVNLLSSSRFWFEQSFEGDEVPFKHFDDFVSVSSRNKSAFRFGSADTNEVSYVDREKVVAPELKGRAFLFKYVDNEGVPKLDSFTTNFRSSSITIYFSENAARYRVSSFDPSEFGSAETQRLLFSRWAKIQDDRSLRGTRIVKDEGVSKGYVAPLYALISVVRDAFMKVSSDGKKIYLMPAFPKPLLGENSAWIAPIRAKPRRTYDAPRLEFSPEGNHVPYLLKRMLSPGRSSHKFVAFLKKFGKESGLFREVKVHKFGSTSTSPFEIEVVLDRGPLNISNVGYGVAQGLPVIVEAFVRAPETVFVVQQPEVHLHPRAQASIGELICTLASKDKKRFIVETHSDFMIDRFRLSVRELKVEVPGSQILFFTRSGGRNSVHPIRINSEGELPSDQPSGYRDFFLNESLRLLEL